jgi:hypothetical protein
LKISTFVERWVLNADGPAAVESNLNTQGVIVVPARPVRSYGPAKPAIWRCKLGHNDASESLGVWNLLDMWRINVAGLQSIAEKGQAN